MADPESNTSVFCTFGGFFTLSGGQKCTILHGIDDLNVYAYDTKIGCVTGYCFDSKVFIVQEYPYPDGTRLCAIASAGYLESIGFVINIGCIIPDAESSYGIQPTTVVTRGQVISQPEYDLDGNIIFNLRSISGVMAHRWRWIIRYNVLIRKKFLNAPIIYYLVVLFRRMFRQECLCCGITSQC